MRSQKKNSLVIITVLSLLAIFANMTSMANEPETDTDSSTVQYDSTEDSGTISTSPTYVSDEEEEDMPSATIEEDSSLSNSTDSDI